MLPIPAPLIGLASAKPPKNNNCCNNNNTSSTETHYSSGSSSHRKFFVPLIYLGGTASLCYLFLFALIIGNEKTHHHHYHHIFRRPFGLLQLALRGNYNNSAKQFYYLSGFPQGSSSASELNKRNRKGKNDQLSSSSSTTTSTFTTQPEFHRKVLHSLRRSERPTRRSQNGTRRSDSTKIWSGHQDLDQILHISITSQIKNELRSKRSFPSEETYIFPWIEDQQCKKFKVQFARRNTFKPRALVSFPGSGNTWLRFLIERASGYFTGSVYNDKSIFESGLLGELRKPNDGTTIVQKTHHDTVGINRVYHEKETEWIFGYRGILIIRNPFDALVSYWNYVNSSIKDRHTGIASESEFKSRKWINFVLTKIQLWTSLITSWIKNSSDYLIIFYEDIRKNPRVELIRILKYLNQTVDAARLDCLMKPKHLEGPFHRAHPEEKTTTLRKEEVPLTNSTLFSTPASTSSLQEKNWKMSPYNKNNLRRNDEQTTLSLLNSKQSLHQHQHPQSLSSSSSSLSLAPSQKAVTATAAAELDGGKKDLFSLSSLSSPLKTISSTSSLQQLQHEQNQDSSNSRTMTRSNDNLGNNNNSNNGPNNSSILRLDLIIQDNIDQINRFFQQKSIPLQLFYSPRPSTMSYFLPTYNPSTFPLSFSSS